MSTTTYSNLRYPQSSDSPNIAQYLQNLATDVDQKVTLQVTNPTARAALVSKYDGMRVYEQSTKRYYWWNAATAAWVYAGGAPPPITAVPAFSGFTAASGLAPGFYRDASGLVYLVGAVTNDSTYTPSGQIMLNLAGLGMSPARDIACVIAVPAGPGFVLGGVYAAGSVRANYNGGASIPAGTVHTFPNIPLHIGFTGGALA